MALYDFPNATQPDNILVQIQTEIPIFIPMFLTFVFFVVLMGGALRQKSRTGTADYPMWSVVASMITLMSALILSVIEGLIRLDWLITIVVITIFSGVWLYFDKKSSEV